MTDELLPFGKDSSGSLVHISHVTTKGLACGLVCPDPNCGRPLVAHLKGQKKKRHLAHQANSPGCFALETMLHQHAKQLIAEQKTLLLPAVSHRGVTLKKEVMLTFDSVRLEQRHHTIVPDILATKNDRELLIEIVVTHRCEDKKKAILAEQKLATVEIDLSKLRSFSDLPALDEAILKSATRYWVFHPDIAARELELEDERRQELDAAAQKLAAQLRKLRSRVHSSDTDAHYGYLQQCGLAHLVGEDLKGGWITGKSSSNWQAPLLWSLIAGGRRTRSDSLYVHEVNAALQKQKSLDLSVVDLASRMVARLQELIPDFASPDQLAASYIASLHAKGFLDHHQRFRPELTVPALEKRDAILNAEKAKEDERRRIAADRKAADDAKAAKAHADREASAAAKRRYEDKIKVEKQIRHLLDDPRRKGATNFNMAKWWKTPLGSGKTPEELLATHSAISTILLRLKNLEKLFQRNASPDVDLHNLPLEHVRATRLQEREDRRAAELRGERERDIEELLEVDPELLPWMDKPLDALDQKTPRQIAGQSSQQLESVRTLAKQMMATQRRRRAERARLPRRSADEFRDRLATFAEAFLRGKAKDWLDTPNAISGGETPRQYCRDQDGFDACLSALQRQGNTRS